MSVTVPALSSAFTGAYPPVMTNSVQPTTVKTNNNFFMISLLFPAVKPSNFEEFTLWSSAFTLLIDAPENHQSNQLSLIILTE